MSELDRYETLRTPRGRAILDELAARDRPDDAALRRNAELRQRYPAELVVTALGQAELRERASAKFGRADRMFLTRDGLEQASSEAVARHLARRSPARAGRATRAGQRAAGDRAGAGRAGGAHARRGAGPTGGHRTSR